MFAALDHTHFVYEFVLWLHILAVIVGFGSTFVWPFLVSRARESGEPVVMLHTSRVAFKGGKVLSTPFIYAAGATGLLLLLFGATGDAPYFTFSQAWVTIAFLLYIVGLVISLGFHTPNLKAMLDIQERLASGPPSTGGRPPEVDELEARGKRAAMFGGILHLLFVLILLDMVFKPGGPLGI